MQNTLLYLAKLLLAQLERTLISGNSKFDKFLLGEVALTPEEQNGFDVFMDEAKGDCFHCHGSNNNPLWTDNQFHNNGLDRSFTDLGLGAVTGDPADHGKFKSPSLRNSILFSFTTALAIDIRIMGIIIAPIIIFLTYCMTKKKI